MIPAGMATDTPAPCAFCMVRRHHGARCRRLHTASQPLGGIASGRSFQAWVSSLLAVLSNAVRL